MCVLGIFVNLTYISAVIIVKFMSWGPIYKTIQAYFEANSPVFNMQLDTN